MPCGDCEKGSDRAVSLSESGRLFQVEAPV